MLIRLACEADAEDAAEVLRRSITELCVQDHQNEPAVLDAWLANKTAATFCEWLQLEHQPLIVAEQHGRVLAVGAVRKPDEILLNYVVPEARFQGVSKQLLVSMEGLLLGFGAQRARLASTRTAYAFYYAAGYRDAGRSGKFGMSTLDMAKELKT